MPVGEGEEELVREFKLFCLAVFGYMTHCKSYS